MRHEIDANLTPLSNEFWEEEFTEEEQEIAESEGYESSNARARNYVTIVCPNCDCDTLIVEENYKGVCANSYCRGVYSVTSCDTCGMETTGYPWQDWTICDGCESYQRHSMEKD